jgi:hypothetical protein
VNFEVDLCDDFAHSIVQIRGVNSRIHHLISINIISSIQCGRSYLRETCPVMMRWRRYRPKFG